MLLFHGNAGNIGDRVPHIALLNGAGFDVLAFDYRGYGRSAGRPSERGTYEDARAARDALGPGRTFYLGESLGGAIALELAIHHPPAGLILQSTFTSVRAMARLHYPFIPRALVPDAYPSLRPHPAPARAAARSCTARAMTSFRSWTARSCTGPRPSRSASRSSMPATTTWSARAGSRRSRWVHVSAATSR